MSQSEKIKISQKEFDDLYEIEEIVTPEEMKKEEHRLEKEPEPEFLTEEEKEHDNILSKLNPQEEEEQ